MSAHDVQALTELLDGELEPARRRVLESHLAGCASCREELERLRGLSKSLRSLPEQPLPSGFMSRLDRRRSGAAGRRASDRFRLTKPVLAFALCSVLVAVVIVDRARVMLSVGGTTLTTDESRLPSAALTEADVEKSRGLKPAKPLAPARGSPIEAPTMAGASTPVGIGPSNEELHADLERQKKAMGIRRIAAKESAKDEWQKAAENEALMAAGSVPPAPKVPEGGTPTDLKTAPEQLAAGKPLPGPERGAPVAAAAAPSGPGALAAQAAQAVASAAADAAPSDAPAEGIVITSEDQRQKVWAERGMHMRPPTVRYDRSEVVLVVAPDMKSAVEVLGVQTRAGGVSVRYRLFPRMAEIADPNGNAPVRSYQFRVIPKTDKPITFDRATD